MSGLALEALRLQFDVAWAFAQHHLPDLTEAMVLWEPAPGAWTVRLADGGWIADWAEREPNPVPATTIAWLAWHIAWWWSEALAAAEDRPSPGRAGVLYPGSAQGIREQLEGLADQWRAGLAGLDDEALARPTVFPWPDARPRAMMVGWAHLELMKNLAEIGAIKHLYLARKGRPQVDNRAADA